MMVLTMCINYEEQQEQRRQQHEYSFIPGAPSLFLVNMQHNTNHTETDRPTDRRTGQTLCALHKIRKYNQHHHWSIDRSITDRTYTDSRLLLCVIFGKKSFFLWFIFVGFPFVLHKNKLRFCVLRTRFCGKPLPDHLTQTFNSQLNSVNAAKQLQCLISCVLKMTYRAHSMNCVCYTAPRLICCCCCCIPKKNLQSDRPSIGRSLSCNVWEGEDQLSGWKKYLEDNEVRYLEQQQQHACTQLKYLTFGWVFGILRKELL